MEATSLYRVKQQIQAAGEFDQIQLTICSPGGYCREGWSIVDYLYGLGKPINTLAYGQCASFGTVIHAMGTVRETTKYCEWMYHRPWDYCAGNDLQVAKFNAGLAKETQKLFGFYAERFAKPIEEVSALIQEDDLFLDPQETVDNGFSTAIYLPGAMATQANTNLPGFTAPLDPAKKQKPVYMMSLGDLKINPDAPKEEGPTGSQSNLKTNTMAEKKKSLMAAAASIVAFFAGADPKALDNKLKDGRTLVTDSTGDTPVIGDDATIDGEAAPDGDYELEKDGVIVSVKDGKVSGVSDPDEEDDTETEGSADPVDTATDDVPDAATVAAILKENKELKAQVSAQDKKLTALESRVTAVFGKLTSQDPQTQANRQPKTPNTAQLSDRDQVLTEHVAKYAYKPREEVTQ